MCFARRWGRRTRRSWRSSGRLSSKAPARKGLTTRKRQSSSNRSSTSPGMASTRRTPRRTRCWPIAPAYLKANHPWHFAASLLTIEAQNTDKLALYLGEARDRDVPILPPDINESSAELLGGARPRGPVRVDGHQGSRRRSGQRPHSRADAARRSDDVTSRTLRDRRSSNRQQACVRGARQGGRLRFTGRRERPRGAIATVRGYRRRLRTRDAHPARQGPGTNPVVRRRGDRCWIRRAGGSASRGRLV